jgi:hypothetical protein
MLSDPDIPVKEKAATDNERKVTFLNLVPGRLYNITLWTVSGGVTSRPLERQVSAQGVMTLIHGMSSVPDATRVYIRG